METCISENLGKPVAPMDDQTYRQLVRCRRTLFCRSRSGNPRLAYLLALQTCSLLVLAIHLASAQAQAPVADLDYMPSIPSPAYEVVRVCRSETNDNIGSRDTSLGPSLGQQEH